MEKEISAGRKDQVLLEWQMVLHKRSTLGSFCCSLFINNLSDIGITARVQRYADNKTLFYSPRSPAGTAKSLQSDFSGAGHFWGCLCQESTASLQSEDEMEKFHGSPAWPLLPRLCRTISHISPRTSQPRSCLPQSSLTVTAHRLHLPESNRKPSLSSFPTSEDITRDCSFHSSHDSSRDGSQWPRQCSSGRTSSHSILGEESLSHDGHTREVLCSPATIPSLLEQRTCSHSFSSFWCEHSWKWAQTTATTLLQTAQPKRTQKIPLAK